MAHQHQEAVFYPAYIAIIKHISREAEEGYEQAYFTFHKNLPVCPGCLAEEFERILKFHLVNRYILHITSQNENLTKEEGLKKATEYRDFLNSLNLAETLTMAYTEGKLTIFGQNDQYFLIPLLSVDYPQAPKKSNPKAYGDDWYNFIANIFRDTYPYIEITKENLNKAIKEVEKASKNEDITVFLDLVQQYILSNNLQEDIQE